MRRSETTPDGLEGNERRIRSLAIPLVALALNFVFAAGGAAQSQTPPAPAPPATHGVHVISVKFDYDFRVTPACTAQVTTNCIQRFVVYDISSGSTPAKRYKLFTITLPASPVGMVHGISGNSPRRDFYSGQHLVGVTAIGPSTSSSPDYESNPRACTAWITIP